MIMWAGERELKLGQGVQLAVHISLLENTESLDAYYTPCSKRYGGGAGSNLHAMDFSVHRHDNYLAQ